MSVLSFGTDPRERKCYYFHKTLTRKIVGGLVKAVLLLIMKIDFEGESYLPEEGPVVLAANHLTNYDVFPMEVMLPRPIFFMGKAELFTPLTDPLFRRLGAFPVYRGEKDQWALRQARRVLAHNQMLGMFPEGSRSKGRGLRAAKTGTARLALEAGCPIVPLAIDGTQRVFRRFPRRTRVKIRIGEPIVPQPEDSPVALTDRLMFTLAEMLPPELRGVYAVKPPGF